MSVEGLRVSELHVLPYRVLGSASVELSLEALAAFRVNGIVAEKNGNKFSFDFSGATVKFAKNREENWEMKLARGPLNDFLAQKEVELIIHSYMRNEMIVCEKLPTFIPAKYWKGKKSIILPIHYYRICNAIRTNCGEAAVDIQLSETSDFAQSILNFQSIVVFDGKKLKPIENLRNSGIVNCGFKKAIFYHLKENVNSFFQIVSGGKKCNGFDIIAKFNFFN